MSDLVWDKLTQLADCLCGTFADADVDELCFCGIVPGAAIAYDYIDRECPDTSGMAWVRLSTQYATRSFPQQLVTSTPCGAEIAVVADLGVIRNIPLGDNGEPPDAAVMQAVAENQVNEAALMRKAVTCCLGDGVILGQYVPVGPDGGAVGGYFTVSIPTLE